MMFETSDHEVIAIEAAAPAENRMALPFSVAEVANCARACVMAVGLALPFANCVMTAVNVVLVALMTVRQRPFKNVPVAKPDISIVFPAARVFAAVKVKTLPVTDHAVTAITV